ncbi:O-antigen ligase family protein [Sphingomonas sp. ACRSK]|uniref:O-antigen ligase family protein n=1 Tax=Sphingomonas sp. ACRSK TaxID=2918213 RepID=UPI001EF6D38A|nr:O-antigen ligase family protein [Sphingomonas sp. ACRSK]MCG7349494.1 O-antigen ligase family protein [Sphingomonas sp. ACRSK]
MVLILATIVLAVAFGWRDGFAALARAPLAGRIVLIGIAALPLLQLVPLPPALWQALPGQDLRRMTLGLAGLADSWQPLTLEPAATALCAVTAIGFVTFTGWLLRLSEDDFRRLLLVALGLVLLGISIGLLQVFSDGQWMVLQAQMGATLLGFFANKNHMALVLACSVLLFGLVVSRQSPWQGRRRMFVGGYTAFALVAIVVTNSRAGLGFGALAAVMVLLDLARGVPLRWRVLAVVVVAALVVAVVSSSAFEIVAGRVDNVSDDLRWRFLGWSWPLAERYGWLGSGFGSFRTLFITTEQLSWVKPTEVNAVHNDYLQLLIEGGIPAMILLTLLAVSLVLALGRFRHLLRRSSARHQLLFGLTAILLFGLHSAVDYPLRRPAAWAFFALALAAVYRNTQNHPTSDGWGGEAA